MASHEFANHTGTDGRDQWSYTSPVGSFQSNGFKLYDMHGNVSERAEDCQYQGHGYEIANIPTRGNAQDGGAVNGGSNDSLRVHRGGS